MAIIKDNNGTEWELRFSLRAITYLCKRLNITMAKLSMLEVPIGELLESLHLLCGKQLRERNITEEQFYDLLDNVQPTDIVSAIRAALVEAFPSAKAAIEGEEGATPFGI